MMAPWRPAKTFFPPVRPFRPAGRLLLAVLPALFFFASPPAAAEDLRAFSPPEEEYAYNIDFFVFKNVAKGTIRIKHLFRNRYHAELLAETKGIASVYTAGRKNHYQSDMSFDRKKRRLITLRHIRTITRGEAVEKFVVSINYKTNELQWVITDNGKVRAKGSEIVPPGVVYEDLLSAFFNFRIGGFGKLPRGRKLTMMTFPDFKKKSGDELEEWTTKKDRSPQEIEVRVADAETERVYRKKFHRDGEKGYLVFAKVPHEVFGQNTGEIRVWFDPKFLPLQATVEDAIFFGDVTGTLIQAKNTPR